MPRPDAMDLMYSFENQGQQALSGLGGLNSAFSGISNASDLRSKYGIKDTSATFAPLFKSLAQNRSRRMQGSAMRAGRSASPEMTFSNVENDYENSLQNLLGNQGQADIDMQKTVAGLLQNAFSSRDQFGLNKYGQMGQMASNLFGNRLNLEQFNRQGEGPGFMDILGTVLGAAAPVAGAAIGKPTTNFNFTSK